MTSGAPRQLAQACQHILNLHLDLLLLLLADRGIPPDQQRARVDRLVHMLHDATLEPHLQAQGRPIPFAVDLAATPPVLTLNSSLLGKSTLQEMVSVLAKPVAQIVGLGPLEVGLVFQVSDEKKLRNLYHATPPKVRAAALRSTAIRAVVERRVERFLSRLSKLVERITDGSEFPLSSPLSLIALLEARGGAWPEWVDLAHDPFALHTQRTLEHVLAQRSSASSMPPARIIIELCWDSIGLSSHSLLKATARRLRAQNVSLDHEFLLRAMAHAVVSPEQEEVEWLEHWPTLGPLHKAWKTLHAVEVQTLGHVQHGASPPPALSLLEPPRRSMGLCQPDSLPWDYPLLCWSEREMDALRDLLLGFAKTTEHAQSPSHALEVDGAKPPAVDERPAPPPLPLEIPPKTAHVFMKFVTRDVSPPANYDSLIARAYAAVFERMLLQYRGLEEKMQTHVLHRIRGSYDGFFPGTSRVWERRFQGWQHDPKEGAFKRLATPVSDLMQCPTFFDPFASPDDATLLPMPRFSFVVALPPDLEKMPFQVPIAALVLTAPTGMPPISVRLVEVPTHPGHACLWRADSILNMDETTHHPVQEVLGSVKGNTLRMLAHQ